MDAALPISGFILVAAITPGPNNLIVMSASANGGVGAAVPAMAGVVGGSLALLALVWAGAGNLFGVVPEARPLFAGAGALYLAWIGATAVRRGGEAERGAAGAPPSTGLGVAIFQILNPKSWLLVVTAASAMHDGSAAPQAFLTLAAMIGGISTACLAVWAVGGWAISMRLTHPETRIRFDRAMGGLLIVSALGLLASEAWQI